MVKYAIVPAHTAIQLNAVPVMKLAHQTRKTLGVFRVLPDTGAASPEPASFHCQVQEGTAHHYRLILNIAESHVHDLHVRHEAD